MATNATPPGDKSATASAVVRRNDGKKQLEIRGKQTFVTIHVGTADAKESFMVQKSLLCHYSPFFGAAFNGHFIEGENQEVTLEDVETDTLEMLVRWVYEQKICEAPGGKVHAIDLCKLWALAERCLIPRLQNQVLDKLNLASGHFPWEALPRGPGREVYLCEVAEYISRLPGDDNPLKRWSTRIILLFLRNWERHSVKLPEHKEGMRKMMGKGVAASVVLALMGECGTFKVDLPPWVNEDFHVAE